VLYHLKNNLVRAEWAYEVEKMEHMKEEIRKDLDVGVEG
jgi:hypothetical protein